MSVWFTATAIGPELASTWGLTPSQTAFLTSAVQLGFVFGTAAAALLNLADVIPSRPYFAGAALLAAIANAALLLVPGYGAALGARFLTGFFLAGVYPPAMKMVATWFRSARGFGIGVVVGALTIGKSSPYLLKALGGTPLRTTVLGATAAALLGAVLVAAFYRDGPWAFPRRPFAWNRVGEIVRHRATRLATFGYLGHMWELYAMWALVSLFLTDAFTATGNPGAARLGTLAGFSVIAVGGIGAVVAGVWADRWGRARIASLAMGVSGVCALCIGWMIGFPIWAVMGVALLWGLSVVADSAQFSALVTEVCPPHAVGTALTLQTTVGFALTAITIPVAAELSARWGWGPAFSFLAIGPVLGIWAMARLSVPLDEPATPTG